MAKKIVGRIKNLRQIQGRPAGPYAKLKARTYYTGTLKPIRGKGEYVFKFRPTRKPYKNQMVEFEIGATGNAIKVRPLDSSIYN